jgi:hypothetical protein
LTFSDPKIFCRAAIKVASGDLAAAEPANEPERNATPTIANAICRMKKLPD